MIFFNLIFLVGSFFQANTDGSDYAFLKSNILKSTPEVILKASPSNEAGFRSLNDSDTLTYAAAKAKISLLKVRLRHELRENQIGIDSVKKTFNDRLANHIIPFWYGTAWSFGGHTEEPGKGNIACGYFISTTLRDMGLKLNRFKLAQKSPIDEAMAISCGEKVTTIEHEHAEGALKEIKKILREGIYFIGFDTGHVGFLVKKDRGISLIHSNYLLPISVCVEPLETARIFKSFTKFHLVNISHNETLIRKWLNGERIL